MTKEQFDRQEFSITTQVKYRGEWYHISEVDFEHRKVILKNGGLVEHYNIEVIKDEAE